jgi:hypothetical protein
VWVVLALLSGNATGLFVARGRRFETKQLTQRPNIRDFECTYPSRALRAASHRDESARIRWTNLRGERVLQYLATVFLLGTLISASSCTRGQAPGQGSVQQALGPADSPAEAHRLSATRLLRKIHLTLLGDEPRPADYESLLNADDAAKQAMLARAIDDALNSPQFYEQMVAFGKDYLRVGSYDAGKFDNSWVANQAVQLTPCPQGTLHAGKLGVFFPNNPALGDPPSICSNPSARTDQVRDPWFAVGTTVNTIGRAGTGVVTGAGGVDCGGAVVMQDYISGTQARMFVSAPDCSCGPHLIYCNLTIYPFSDYPPTDGDNYVADSQRRAGWEEPSRLFAHVITRDKPFSDLVIGNYTVVNLKLQHMYVRLARQNSANRTLDDSQWFMQVTDPLAWREVPFEAMHPNLLSRRSYSIDPRQDASEPAGFPSAGVLTSIGSMSTFARERVRAARWLETFACRSFAAPPAEIAFSLFQGDPYSGGQCQYCHRQIDPAAIFFKRVGFGDDGKMYLGGIGPGRWDDSIAYLDPFSRWYSAFAPGLFLTHSSDADFLFNPNARFIDFLPTPDTMFGMAGDGTIGPLGFGKLLVDSGEFDRCAVRRIFQRMMGRDLDPANESDLIQQLAQDFQANGRKVKPFIRGLLATDAFGRGW